MMAAGWDDDYPSLRDLLAQIIIPSASEEQRRQYAEDMREIISPENIARYREIIDNIDVTELLPNVEAPCLVTHCTGDRMHPIDQSRLFAARLPDSRFIAYESDNHIVPENDPVWPILERDIQAFLAAHT
jgi:pimeloyl-ACP methyl ester carboxylesterase